MPIMMRSFRRFAVAATALSLVVAPRLLSAQERGATALGEAVAGLDVTVRVLVIGAHPDDEDTQLITWLARGRQVETAYLSLTRGDGGQNLIGNELGPVLGMIRTEELLAARRLDGGRQFFTRAYDFGFSKTAEETYQHWPKDSILRDVVTVVRSFRPQIIVAVFSGTPRDGHGHHQVSAILAREAFDAAMDTVAWPRARTNGLGAWRPLKFYRASRFSPAEATLRFNVGELSALRGQSYAELASQSRSQHLSQGFGGLQRRGASTDYLKLEESRVGPVGAAASERSPLDGIAPAWGRFVTLDIGAEARAALDSLPAAVSAVRAVTNLAAPAAMVAPLARAVRLVQAARERLRCEGQPATGDAIRCAPAYGDLVLALETARRRGTAALLSAAGVSVEATAPRALVAVGDTLPVTVTAYNQGGSTIHLSGAVAMMRASGGASGVAAVDVAPDSAASVTLRLAPRAAIMPWWLTVGRRGDVFALPEGNGLIGASEERIRDAEAQALLRIAGTPVTVDAGEIVQRVGDPARGEVRRPVSAVPAISVLFDDEVEYARAGVPLERTFTVRVRSGASAQRGVTATLQLPAGLTADSSVRRATVAPFGETAIVFRVRGVLPVGRHQVSATVTSSGETYSAGWVPVDYAHIRPLRFYRAAIVQVEAVQAALPPRRQIAYIQGVGDNVAPMLSQLGLAVTIVSPESLATADLSRYGAIVIGPRAFAASPALAARAPRLQAFARAGGTVVVQYGQQEMQTPELLPYPMTLARTAERVTIESAPVRIIDPASRVLGSPNRITPADFTNWVQERSTYMPTTADPHWQRVLEMHDPGEAPNENSVLVAPVGKGTYVYVTLALFRQLPAGIPGPARIFLNLIAADGASARPAAAQP